MWRFVNSEIGNLCAATTVAMFEYKKQTMGRF
jgi:hypothetical protein